MYYNMRAVTTDMPELDMNGGSLSKNSQKVKVQVETKNRFGKFVLMMYIRRAI
jgi:translation initiation factor 1 (eIF-1/SUI1)